MVQIHSPRPLIPLLSCSCSHFQIARRFEFPSIPSNNDDFGRKFETQALSFAKTHAAFGINHIAASSRLHSAMTACHVSLVSTCQTRRRNAGSPFSLATGSPPCEFGIASAVGSAEAAPSASKPRELRPTFLDSRSACMVRLEAVAHLRQPGNRCPLAQSRVSSVLEVAF